MLFFAVDKKPRPIELKTKPQSNNDGSVANIYKGQAALIYGRNYPANAINCL
jgi:hypothetical protein